MQEQRVNWKQNVADQTKERMDKRQKCIDELAELRTKINEASSCRQWAEYDKLMARRAEVTAELATI